MQANPSEWCTIESDPGVFTQLIEGIGVKNVQVEELYSLDDPAVLQELKPIYGLIFLFKWTSKIEPVQCMDYYDQNLFFANQVIQNACATQAILSILLNCDNEIDIGEQLKEFKQFTKEMDPQMKGLAISNSDLIKTQHNSFARAEPFVFEQKRKAKEDDEVYHFIAYVPFGGKVYELDGLQKGPVILGNTSEDWVEVAKMEIDKRIKNYAENEIRFNLLAIIKNKKSVKENQRRQHNYIPFILELLHVIGEKGKLSELVEIAKKKKEEQKKKKEEDKKKKKQIEEEKGDQKKQDNMEIEPK